MDPVAETALEAVAVEQRHEELTVGFLAVVRRRRHQQEMARERREKLAEPVTLGVLGLGPEHRGRHSVRLVAHDEIPATIGRLELVLHLLVARELVETGDDQVRFQEPVAGPRRFEFVVGQDLKRQVEAVVQLVLPLLGEAAGANDEAPLQVASRNQLLHEQPGHDGLAGARVVGQEKSERLARQHGLIDGRDLMRQRIDQRRVDCQHGVKQMCELNAVQLGHQTEEVAVAVEAPGAAPLDDIEPRLVMAVQQLVRNFSSGCLVGQLEGVGAEPLHADDGDEAVGKNAAYRGGGLQVFKARHIGNCPRSGILRLDPS